MGNTVFESPHKKSATMLFAYDNDNDDDELANRTKKRNV